MPFDVTISDDAVLRTLIAVDQRLATEADWCDCNFGLKGGPACLMGHYYKVGPWEKRDEFARALGLPDSVGVMFFNDDHGYEAVKVLLASAIARRLSEHMRGRK